MEVAFMKKKNILSLIRYHAEKNEAGFRNEAYEIAKEFDKAGDYQLAEYIMSLLSNVNTFVPQMDDSISPFFEKIEKLKRRKICYCYQISLCKIS